MNEDDHLLVEDDKTIFAVDAETLRLVEGSTIDYEDRMVRSAFVVFNYFLSLGLNKPLSRKVLQLQNFILT